METDDRQSVNRKLRGKNLAVALTIAGLCVLFYVVSIVRMSGNG